MSILAKHLKNARLIDTPLGNLTTEHVYQLELEYRKTGTIKARSLTSINLCNNNHNVKREVLNKRGDTSLTNLEMWKKDINYISSELANIGSMRSESAYSQDKISYALNTASKITKCLSTATLKINSKKGTHKASHGYWRCKSQACPYCNYIKLKERQRNFLEGINSSDIKLDYKYSSLITIYFRDRSKTQDEITRDLKLLNKSMSQILGYNHIRKVVAGSARSIEVIEDAYTSGDSHVHLHALVLFTKFKGLSKKKLAKYLKDKTGKSVEVHFSKPKFHTCTQDPNERYKELIEGFNYLNKTFGLKTKDRSSKHHIFGNYSASSITDQSSDFYIKMLPAVKGQRMFNTTGIIKKALSAGKKKTAINRADYQSSLYSKENYSNDYALLYWRPKSVEFKSKDKTVNLDLGEYHIDHFQIKKFIDSLTSIGMIARAKIISGENISTTESCKIITSSLELQHNKDPVNPGDQLPLFLAKSD